MGNNELVNKQDLINYIHSDLSHGTYSECYDGSTTIFTQNEVNQMIIDCQAANETERKTGRWVEAHGMWCTPGGDPVWECSECGKGRHVYGIEHGSYGSDIADHQWVACPNCGALMEE